MTDDSLVSTKNLEISHQYWVIQSSGNKVEFTSNEIYRMIASGLLKYVETTDGFLSFKHIYEKSVSDWERNQIVTEYLDTYPDRAQSYLDKNYKGPVLTDE